MRMLSIIALTTLFACRTDKSIIIQNPAPKAEIVSHQDGDVLEGIPTICGWCSRCRHLLTKCQPSGM